MAVSTDRQGRYEHGKVVLDAIDGEAGEKVIDALGDVSPELAHQVVAWGLARCIHGRAWSLGTGSWSRSGC